MREDLCTKGKSALYIVRDMVRFVQKGKGMTTLTASRARAKLYKLLDETAASHRPIQIMGKRASAVLISEEDWRAIQETLFLLSIPGMRESICKGMKTPASKCSKTLKW